VVLRRPEGEEVHTITNGSMTYATPDSRGGLTSYETVAVRCRVGRGLCLKGGLIKENRSSLTEGKKRKKKRKIKDNDSNVWQISRQNWEGKRDLPKLSAGLRPKAEVHSLEKEERGRAMRASLEEPEEDSGTKRQGVMKKPAPSFVKDRLRSSPRRRG